MRHALLWIDAHPVSLGIAFAVAFTAMLLGAALAWWRRHGPSYDVDHPFDDRPGHQLPYR